MAEALQRPYAPVFRMVGGLREGRLPRLQHTNFTYSPLERCGRRDLSWLYVFLEEALLLAKFFRDEKKQGFQE
ncbi:hypothetical protein AC482_02095 [miscellaneous Crenarchaeota group-15 archaeon DG-45]|uniref:Uncharacterized protein n=1 Tax=miscellaneous Crenarchaeota group-15 archaeon DG-45 TaxID=1685127 RepID=A0A0M0BS61_9ARCH|nr:MAG: hypothetical protein AC482_02095 [miscellaneous Crenarchaeota group-15 archaeon DG-45]